MNIETRTADIIREADRPRPIDRNMSQEEIEAVLWQRFLGQLPFMIPGTAWGGDVTSFCYTLEEEWLYFRADQLDDAHNSGPGIKGELA